MCARCAHPPAWHASGVAAAAWHMPWVASPPSFVGRWQRRSSAACSLGQQKGFGGYLPPIVRWQGAAAARHIPWGIHVRALRAPASLARQWRSSCGVAYAPPVVRRPMAAQKQCRIFPGPAVGVRWASAPLSFVGRAQKRRAIYHGASMCARCAHPSARRASGGAAAVRHIPWSGNMRALRTWAVWSPLARVLSAQHEATVHSQALKTALLDLS